MVMKEFNEGRVEEVDKKIELIRKELIRGDIA